MDKVQRRALGFAVWVILALIVTLLSTLTYPGCGVWAEPCACRSWCRLCLWNGGNGSDEPRTGQSALRAMRIIYERRHVAVLAKGYQVKSRLTETIPTECIYTS